jgi:hypothetical protein
VRTAAGPASAQTRPTPISVPSNTGIVVGMQASRNQNIDLTRTDEVAGGPRKRAAPSAQSKSKRVRDADAAAAAADNKDQDE